MTRVNDLVCVYDLIREVNLSFDNVVWIVFQLKIYQHDIFFIVFITIFNTNTSKLLTNIHSCENKFRKRL